MLGVGKRLRLKWTCHYFLFAHLNQLRLNLQYKYIFWGIQEYIFYLLKISIPNTFLHFLHLAPGTMSTCLEYYNSLLFILIHWCSTFLNYPQNNQNFFFKVNLSMSSRITCTMMRASAVRHGLPPLPVQSDLIPWSLSLSATVTWIFKFTKLLLPWEFCKHCLF